MVTTRQRLQRGLALAAGAFLLVVLTLLALRSPSLRAAAPRIAYVTPERTIAVMAVSGGSARLISPPLEPVADQRLIERAYAWPSWSPDGRRIAFLAIGPAFTGALLVAGADGAQQTTTVHEFYGHPVYQSWSPDGTRLATLVNGADTIELLLGEPDRTSSGRRVGSGQPIYSAWAPDGGSLLVHSGGGREDSRPGRLQLVSATDGVDPEAVELEPSGFRAPAWSPSGDWQMLGGRNGSAGEALFRRGRDGRVSWFASVDGEPAVVWSPTEERFLWSTAIEFPYAYRGLEVATADGRTRRRLTEERLLAFFWSPDGRQIAYVAPDEAYETLELRVLAATGGPARTVARFQPTRDFIQLVTYFDQYAQSTTIWSPDSRTLIFAGWLPGADREKEPWLYTVPADGTLGAQALVAGRIGFFEPARSAPATPRTPQKARSAATG